MDEKPQQATSTATRVRCAIYTRKSTEEGLNQDFNSLEAQREAAVAYIRAKNIWAGLLLLTIPAGLILSALP